MGRLDKAVQRNQAVPGGRSGTESAEDIKEGSPVGVPNGISGGQEDGRNQDVFLYRDRGSTARRGVAVGCQPGVQGAVGCEQEGGAVRCQLGRGRVAVSEQWGESQRGWM